MGKRYIPDIAAIQRMWRCKREIGKRNGSVTTAIFCAWEEVQQQNEVKKPTVGGQVVEKQ